VAKLEDSKRMEMKEEKYVQGYK
jgi:hypothetical protein